MKDLAGIIQQNNPNEYRMLDALARAETYLKEQRANPIADDSLEGAITVLHTLRSDIATRCGIKIV